MPIVRQIKDKLICGKCGSGQVYTKQKATILVCRLCGTEENIDKENGHIKLIDKNDVKQ